MAVQCSKAVPAGNRGGPGGRWAVNRLLIVPIDTVEDWDLEHCLLSPLQVMCT